MAPKRIIGNKKVAPMTDIEPTKTPGVSSAARSAAARTDRGAGASLFNRRRRTRGSGRYSMRRTA